MSDSFSIKEYLIENRSEVEMLCLTEYDEAETMGMFKEEGRQEGIQHSIEKLAKHLMSENPELSEEDAVSQAKKIISE